MKSNFTKIKDIMKQLSGLTFIGAGNVIGTLISGIFWLYLATLLGAENYGQITYLISIGIVVSTISTLGGNTFITVYSAKKIEIQSFIYFIGLIASSVSAIILFMMFQNIGLSIYVVGFVTFNLIINEMLGNKFFKKYSKFLIFQRIMMVLLALLFYYYIGMDGIILGIAFSFLPFVIHIYKIFKIQDLNFSLIKSRFGFLMNSYGLDLGTMLSINIDKILIPHILSFEILGNYALSAQIINVLTILPGIVYQYTLPHDSSGISYNFLKKIVILSAVAITIIVLVFSPFVLPIFFPQFTDSVIIIQIMSIILVPAAITQMYTSKFLGAEKSKYVIINRIIQLCIFIPLIVILGNIFGIMGVAIAMVLGQISMAIFLVFNRRKINGL